MRLREVPALLVVLSPNCPYRAADACHAARGMLQGDLLWTLLVHMLRRKPEVHGPIDVEGFSPLSRLSTADDRGASDVCPGDVDHKAGLVRCSPFLSMRDRAEKTWTLPAWPVEAAVVGQVDQGRFAVVTLDVHEVLLLVWALIQEPDIPRVQYY